MKVSRKIDSCLQGDPQYGSSNHSRIIVATNEIAMIATELEYVWYHTSAMLHSLASKHLLML